MNTFFNSRKSIFNTLIIGKIILLPIIYLALNYFELRDDSLFILPDFKRYDQSNNILDVFNVGKGSYHVVANVGYMFFIALVKSITNIELIRKLIYSLFSLITITYSQTIVLDIVFSERKNSKLVFKFSSIFLSLFNFYILIYSFKPGTDVFGCFGVAILIDALIKSKKVDTNKDYFLKWLFIYLITCLFRNTLILILPFLFFTKIFKETIRAFLNK